MLIGCAHSLKRAGHKMVLLGAQPLVEEVLRTAGIDRIVPLVGSEEEALAAVAG